MDDFSTRKTKDRHSFALVERTRVRRVIRFLVLVSWSLLGAISTQAQSNYEPYSFTTLAGLSPGTVDGQGGAARFLYPQSMVTDGAGNVFVADSVGNTIRKVTPDGIVTTFAGSADTRGYIDGQGTAALFDYPAAVAIDNAGNLLVTDNGNSAVRKITPSGMVTTFVGGTVGTGSAPPFYSLRGIAMDGSGNIYVSDDWKHIIQKVTSSGTISTLAGVAFSPGFRDAPGDQAWFNTPTGLAVDSLGNIYVADTDNDAIRIVAPNGDVHTYSFTPYYQNTNDTGYYEPRGVLVDNTGSVYVADTGSNTIRKIDPVSRNGVSIAGSAFDRPGSVDGSETVARFYGPTAMAPDGSGGLYVADGTNATIRKIDSAGGVSTLAGVASPGSADGPANAARFSAPAGVAVDSAGNVYVSDTRNYTVRKINADGTVTTLAGSPGLYGSANGNGSEARFGNTMGLAVDNAGNVFVADPYNSSIRKIAPNGDVSTAAQLYFNYPDSPSGVAVDSAENLYVADTGANRVVKVTPSGQQTVLASFNQPSGVTLDGTGNIYVADTNYDRIRKITPAGTVSTIGGGWHPTGVAADAQGNVYFTNNLRDTINKIAPDGVQTILGGLADNRGSSDGIGSAARFLQPAGIAVDSVGKIYVVDTYNNVVRVGTPTPAPQATITYRNQNLLVTGQTSPDAAVQISATTDLTTPFVTIATVTADDGGNFQFQDPNASSFTQRYYRATLPQSSGTQARTMASALRTTSIGRGAKAEKVTK